MMDFREADEIQDLLKTKLSGPTQGCSRNPPHEFTGYQLPKTPSPCF